MVYLRTACDAAPVGAASRRALRMVRGATDSAPGFAGAPEVMVRATDVVRLALTILGWVLSLSHEVQTARGPPVTA